MFKLMICDDENLSLEDLSQNFDWAAEGFDLVATANNANSILEELERTELDLLITDIHMIGMSGLELVKELKSRSPNTKVIVISGYADFNYAKEAISLGVHAYVLKPIDENELLSAVRECKNELEFGNMDNKFLQWVRNGEQEVLSEYIRDSGNKSILISNGATIEELENSTDNLKTRLTSKTWLYLVNENKLNDIIIYGRENLKGVALAQIDDSAINFQDAILSAYIRSWDFFILNNDPLFPSISSDGFNNESRSNYSHKLDELQAILENFKNKSISFKSASDELETIFSELDEYAKDITIEEAHSLYQTVFARNENYGSSINMQWLKDEDPYQILLSNFNNYADLFSQAKKVTNNIIEDIVDKEPKELSVGETIAKYIDENFKEAIDLEMVSSTVGLSKPYTSEQLQKETGMSFSGYLAHKRMQEAESLLSNTKMSVNDIAYEVGYQDPAYFRRTFKKLRNQTPSEYRKFNSHK